MKLIDLYGKITLVGIFIVLPLTVILVSPGKPFWFDELFSYYLLSDESFGGMLRAFDDQINNTPIVYFLVGWVWAQVFGASELSLRLFSSLSLCCAALLLWRLLARNYGSWAASLATTVVFATSLLILEQNIEARMYGLFMLVTASALLQYDRTHGRGAQSNLDVVGAGLIHAVLLHTHLFGMFYSFAIVACGVLVDRLRSRANSRLYIAYGLAWLTLLAYLPVFLNQAEAGRPRSWIPPPTLGDLRWFYLDRSLLSAYLVVGFPIAVGLIRLLRRGAPNQGPLRRTGWRELLSAHPTTMVGYVLLLVPLAVWFVSLFVKPVFFERYLIPSLFGVSIILAQVISYIDGVATMWCIQRNEGSALARAILSLLRSPVVRALPIVLFLTVPVVQAWNREGSGAGDLAYFDGGNDGIPIVNPFATGFLQERHYHPIEGRSVYLLDRESAISPASGTWTPQEHNHMVALLRNYPERFAGYIVDSDEFLSTHDRFLVWDYADYDYACASPYPWYSMNTNNHRWKEALQCPRFLEEVILPNSNYSITVINTIETGDSRWGDFAMLLVQREPS